MKQALVIMPNFYAYSVEVKKELEDRGYCVSLYYEQPPNILYLIMRRMSRWFKTEAFFEWFSSSLYNRIRKEKTKYDFFLVIRGNVITENTIDKIKTNLLQSGARNVYYTWDSLAFLYHKGNLGFKFGQRFTFDSKDAKENEGWELLPLFYSDAFDGDKHEKGDDYKYDLCCIAGFNETRYSVIKKIEEQNPKLKLYVRLYIGEKLFRYKKALHPLYRKLDMNWISFKSLSPEEVAKINSDSKIILDYTAKNQIGLSMRTIEAIGLRRKLITNNKAVKSYEFYNDNNVYCIDIQNEDYKIPQEWINGEYKENESIRKRYSIKNWLSALIG